MRGVMSSTAPIRRLAFAVPLLCVFGAGGCSLDFLVVSLCATEREGFAIEGPTSFTSSHGGVSVAVGDSIRLVGHGFCRDAGLHVVIASSSVPWHSGDESIVRISPGADSSAANGDEMPTVWAVGVAMGSTIVTGEAGATVVVNVVGPTTRSGPGM